MRNYSAHNTGVSPVVETVWQVGIGLIGGWSIGVGLWSSVAIATAPRTSHIIGSEVNSFLAVDFFINFQW